MLTINVQVILLIYYNLDLKQIEIPQIATVLILILVVPKAVLLHKVKSNVVRTVGPLSVFTAKPGSLFTCFFQLTRSPCPEGGRDTSEYRNKEVPEREDAFFYPYSAAA